MIAWIIISLEKMDQRKTFILLFLCYTHGRLEIVPHTKDSVPEKHNPFPFVLCLIRFNPVYLRLTIAISHVDTLDSAR